MNTFTIVVNTGSEIGILFKNVPNEVYREGSKHKYIPYTWYRIYNNVQMLRKCVY